MTTYSIYKILEVFYCQRATVVLLIPQIRADQPQKQGCKRSI